MSEDEFEKCTHEEQQYRSRIDEQKSKDDYTFDKDNNQEVCDQCGNYINSHGHCPRCDY